MVYMINGTLDKAKEMTNKEHGSHEKVHSGPPAAGRVTN